MQKRHIPEQRRYLRLNSVFPVEVFVPSSGINGRDSLVQAFTRDVSIGGLCITVNDPARDFLALVSEKNPIIDIHIDMPITGKPVEAKARVAWCDTVDGPRVKKLRMGLSYEDIAPRDRKRIINFARRVKWLPRAAALAIIALIGLLGFSNYNSAVLGEKNSLLIEQFHKVREMNDLYKKSMGKIDTEYASLEEQLSEKDKILAELNERFGAAGVPEDEKIQLEYKLASVTAEKKEFEDKIKSILEKKEKAVKLFRGSRLERGKLDAVAADNMYDWLKTHQNRLSGLIMSFEGDPSIKDWAFTYDQSLVAQAFLIRGDVERVEKILSFYMTHAKTANGGFYNAYNVMSGNPVEYTVNTGPNVWIGIAAVQYTNKTKDNTYLALAENVAKWVISLQDAEGGIKGGPGIEWYSTEHNLDAYTIFDMLYKVTGKERYKKAATRTLKWIKDNTYSPRGRLMKRGKGDSTIATDTMSWAIAAIGPATLLKEGMDPDGIMKFAEENCAVETIFAGPDGNAVKVSGFDFGKAGNLGRSGVISTEWTAQMVISFEIMSDYYASLSESDKMKGYREKGLFFLNELDKMIISSPSKSGQGAGCLPYASRPASDTGHGWRTPSGKQTGSVAGTAYTLFAKKKYNPLSLK